MHTIRWKILCWIRISSHFPCQHIFGNTRFWKYRGMRGQRKNSKVPLISAYYWDFDSKKPDRHLGYLWWKPRKTITSNTISGEVWITAPDFDLFAVQFDHRTVWCPHQFDLKRIIYQRVQTKSLLIREKSRSCKIGFWMLSEVSKS